MTGELGYDTALSLALETQAAAHLADTLARLEPRPYGSHHTDPDSWAGVILDERGDTYPARPPTTEQELS